ncbi:hypothetical protein SAMN05216525_104113 [Bradyrhizobium sp. Gha]|nr:hypothetical protein SAMN05216525_104113 [Bradyrhizobium sp. Gha]
MPGRADGGDGDAISELPNFAMVALCACFARRVNRLPVVLVFAAVTR